MCLILFALHSHPRYKLVMIANRDEFYARPSLSAHYWTENPHVLAGKDLVAGGTWIGIHKKGNFAAITNYRDPQNIRGDAQSRGELADLFLQSQIDPLKYMFQVQFKKKLYNGFNLLVGDIEDLFYYSNYAQSIVKVPAGIHGLSNHLLNSDWYKVSKGKSKLELYLQENPENLDTEALFELMDDPMHAPDAQIQQTGLSPEREKILSPMFITSPDYGTCCSTVLLWDRHNQVTFAEKTFRPNQTQEFNTFSFEIEH